LDNSQAINTTGFFHTDSGTPRQNPQFRLTNFAKYTAEQIQASRTCGFARLSHQELVLCVATWYDSCAQAMLKCNYSLIDRWVCKLARVSAKRGLELSDFLELLRICRRCAIDIEKWDEDFLSSMDDVIVDVLRRGVENPSWSALADLNYLGLVEESPVNAAPVERVEPAPMFKEEPAVDPASERRIAGRKRMVLPIRVCGNGVTGYRLDMVLNTENLSPGGLYFVANEPFAKGVDLQVICPYTEDRAAAKKLLSAKVVRVDRRQDKSRGVAVRFLDPIPGAVFLQQIAQVKTNSAG
jgi:hypothetical protein